MLVFSPFALWHLFPSISSSSLHLTCVNRRDRLVSVFTICSMAPFSIYFVIISSSYMRCVDRRDRLVCVFASCSMVPFSIYFVIICSSVSECVCVLQQDSSLRDLRGLKRAQGGQNLDSQVRMRKPAREAGCAAFFADWGLALG